MGEQAIQAGIGGLKGEWIPTKLSQPVQDILEEKVHTCAQKPADMYTECKAHTLLLQHRLQRWRATGTHPLPT